MRIRALAVAAGVCCIAASLSGQQLRSDRVYPAFGVGPTGIRATIEKDFVVKVVGVVAGSPAAKSTLRVGDVLVAAGGMPLVVGDQQVPHGDPRIVLGDAVGQAEARHGRFVVDVMRDGKKRTATLKLPVLGPYTNAVSPRKSRRIIEQTVEFLVRIQNEEGGYAFGEKRAMRDNVQGCLATLFLLSAGDDKLLPRIERHVLPLAKRAEKRKNAGGHVNWQLGYQGILLSEYFLRSGDQRVLAGLQELCDWAIDNQAAGGWGHGENVGPGYTQSGLMNHAGLPILITLILAQQCGLDIDREAFMRALRLMYRMAGHGCIAYGDHRAELAWSTTNGRNAMLACALSLIPQNSSMNLAGMHLGQLVTDSYFQPEFGHTGGGFNVMWRGLGSAHVRRDKQVHLQRQRDALAWYFDLCRQFGGGFSMPATPPDNARYTGLAWGTGAVGLWYTAPLRTLAITGAPRSKHAREVVVVPDRVWGAAEDSWFLRCDHAAGFGDEAAPPHIVYDVLVRKRKSRQARELASPEFCAEYLRHYSPMVRTWAARTLAERRDEASIAVLEQAAAHDDPRVRRAAFDGVSGYDNWRRPPRPRIASAVVSARFLPAILEALKRPDAAWWEIDGALFALGRALPKDIRANLSVIRKFSEHEDWYLREAAFWALVGLHETITAEEFDLLAFHYANSRHVFERSSLDAGFRVLLKSDKVALERVSMQRAVTKLGRSMHAPKVALGYGVGGIHEAAHRTMMIMKHFDPSAYELMVDDFVKYLDAWEPYWQHSVWLITGSKWQPGILAVVEQLGVAARPIVAALQRAVERYGAFDAKRNRRQRDGLEQAMRDAIARFELAHGRRK